MVGFSINIKGRVKNFPLPKNQPLIPLYEAIVNSFHAIDERKKKDPDFKNGHITIFLEREGQFQLNGVDSLNCVENISVVDNGIGFNEDNFLSFMESDSTYKEAFGGKGVGRFSWLVVFEKALIESIYNTEEGYVKRSFDFTTQSNKIDDILVDVDAVTDNQTCVTLQHCLSPYKDAIPKQLNTIAMRILHHCLIYFMSDDCPQVDIRDEQENLNLNQLFKEKIKTDDNKVLLKIEDQDFELLHVKAEELAVNGNRLFLCAHNRLVETKDLDKYITDLDRAIYEKAGFWYIGVLRGKYLDDNVDMNRLSFSIPEGGIAKNFLGILSMDKILDVTVNEIKTYLNEYLIPIGTTKIKNIKNYVINKAPQFRHLIKFMPDAIAQIKPNLSEEKLDDELHKIKRDFDKEIREQNKKLLDSLQNDILTEQEYIDRFQKQVAKVSEANSAVLAEYIAHRKVIIDLLEMAIRKNEDGEFQKEKYIHDLVYPMRTTSEEEPYDSHNLWLIDEKLAYCSYITSDIPFNNSPKEKRTDIMVLDCPVAVSNDNNDGTEFDTIVLFELKRPMRDDYTDGDNPIDQLYNYVDKIKTGKVKDKDGRFIRAGEHTKFYLYAICDVTPNMERIINHGGIFNVTPDKMGYYGYNQRYNAYVEVLPFDKIINDSKKRNKVLFDKLGL